MAFPADVHLRQLALAAVQKAAPEAKAVEGRVCSGDQFISSAAQKEAITSRFGGECCEMEGGAIAQVCWLNKVPFVIIRAISDAAEEDSSVSYETFMETAAKRCAAVVQEMIALKISEDS
jgi:adenosylhomocysteine nucleosidase